jgi:hypothetical protein
MYLPVVVENSRHFQLLNSIDCLLGHQTRSAVRGFTRAYVHQVLINKYCIQQRFLRFDPRTARPPDRQLEDTPVLVQSVGAVETISLLNFAEYRTTCSFVVGDVVMYRKGVL